ncbi:MAG: helix-turn-helix transcriptional regulator [Bacteroidia bacterium]|nr:helix-turn-helix transcriptional regulator [Bacteroidia bacterium]
MVEADVSILHRGDFYRVLNFKCHCTECSLSAKEYNKAFDICFVRAGYFEYNIFRNRHEVHIGRVLLTKPGTEHTTATTLNDQPDLCTVLDFTPAFYERMTADYGRLAPWFFHNNDVASVLINTSPQINYFHRQLLAMLEEKQHHMPVDELVLRIVGDIMRLLTHCPELPELPASLKRYHLATVENALAFLHDHFNQNISLQQLADHCCVSLFHFSRIFKSVMRSFRPIATSPRFDYSTHNSCLRSRN